MVNSSAPQLTPLAYRSAMHVMPLSLTLSLTDTYQQLACMLPICAASHHRGFQYLIHRAGRLASEIPASDFMQHLAVSVTAVQASNLECLTESQSWRKSCFVPHNSMPC